MFKTLALAATLIAAPALAHPDSRATADGAGDRAEQTCTTIHRHVPAGKIVHAPATVRCTAEPVLARNDAAPRTPATPVTAQD